MITIIIPQWYALLILGLITITMLIEFVNLIYRIKIKKLDQQLINAYREIKREQA